jgi:Ca2+-binding RTX toxin-like protein
VSGNTANSIGGGVYSGGLSGSRRSDVVLTRTLISGNTASNSGAEVYQRTGGVISATKFNLFGHSALTTAQAIVGFTPGTYDITATSDGTQPTALVAILNATLGNNGGPTRTHALVSGSPAVDAASTGCPPPAKDQRGVPRPQDGNQDTSAFCDIGAFERVPPGVVTCDGLPATKVGTAAAETLNGTAGVDVIHGLGGNDGVQGLGGNDTLCGGLGNDRLAGAGGNDRMFGQGGADNLDGGAGTDSCDGGSGTDTASTCETRISIP